MCNLCQSNYEQNPVANERLTLVSDRHLLNRTLFMYIHTSIISPTSLLAGHDVKIVVGFWGRETQPKSNGKVMPEVVPAVVADRIKK